MTMCNDNMTKRYCNTGSVTRPVSADSGES